MDAKCTDGTTSHSTKAAKDAAQVAGYGSLPLCKRGTEGDLTGAATFLNPPYPPFSKGEIFRCFNLTAY